MNIAEVLHDNAALRPEAIALIDAKRGHSRGLTFSELEQAAGQVARLLRQSGLERGNTVLVLHPMSAELYIVLVAIFRLGLVAMFLEPSAGREHINRCCTLRPPEGIVASARAHLLRFGRRSFAVFLPSSPSVRECQVQSRCNAPNGYDISRRFSLAHRILPHCSLSRAAALPNQRRLSAGMAFFWHNTARWKTL